MANSNSGSGGQGGGNPGQGGGSPGQGGGDPGQGGGNPGQGGGGNPGQGGGPQPVTIFVNGTGYEVDKGRLSYEDLLVLIKAPVLPPDKRYSVQYSKGPKDKPTGTLIEGQSVEVKKDMEFDVTPANRS